MIYASRRWSAASLLFTWFKRTALGSFVEISAFSSTVELISVDDLKLSITEIHDVADEGK